MKLPSLRTTAIAIAAGTVLAGGAAIAVSAASGDTGTVLVATTPTRVLDTREAGALFGTLGPDSTSDLNFTGQVPADARAVQLNVTVVKGTQPSFLTVWPKGEAMPTVSLSNWSGPAPFPNGTTVKLGADQSVSFFNKNGTVEVIVDLMGYYVDAPAGGEPGPAGPAGPTGAAGADGADGADGAPGVSGIETKSATATFVHNVENTVTVTCPSGKKVLSGGFSVAEDIGSFDGHRFTMGPAGTTGWKFTGTSGTVADDDQSVTVYAVCATVAG